MKIGVITFWKSKDNYGQILQSYALQQYLRNHGHVPFLIRYENTQNKMAYFKWKHLFAYIFKFPMYATWYIKQKLFQRAEKKYYETIGAVNRHFDDFMNKYIKHTDIIYTESNIYDNPPIADAYICGSDQVWGGDWAYYLDFVADDKTKIAYAPSLGGLTSFAPEYEEKMKQLLQRFDFVGMREQSGVEVCHRMGRRDTVRVADPTLLLTKEDYDKIRINTIKQNHKPYLFLYVLGNPMACEVRDIYAYANKRRLEVKYVASAGKSDEFEHIYPQVGEWIDLIANAEMIITNSFHGTVFSLIYQKPFATILLNQGYERMNTRVLELLESAKLSDHVYKGDFSDITTKIDFSQFVKYRADEECKAYAYLKPHIA